MGGASVFAFGILRMLRHPKERSTHLFPLSSVVSVHNLPWPDDAKSPTSLTQTLAGDAILIPIQPRGVAWTGVPIDPYLVAGGEGITII